MSRPPRHACTRAAVCLALVALGACAPRSSYKVPVADVPAAYKELGDWSAAQPSDEVARGQWWVVFQDPPLSALEQQVTVSSQALKAAESQFAQARALVTSARSARYPQVTGGLLGTQADQSANKPYAPSPTRYGDYMLRSDVSYELDVWGRVGRSVDAAAASAQASAADVESVGLSVHAELALDYFQLRSLDVEKQILDASVANYERALELTKNRERGGIATGADVAQAETQLETTRAQAIDVQVRRAQFEHAIAVLVGQPASTFTVAAITSPIPPPPDVPPGLPSRVLERRPDIAAAERRVAAANAQVGVVSSAFFPVLSITGSLGFETAGLGNWLRAASNLWSVAPTAALALMDGGRRRSAVDQARAGYDRAEATYRDTLLTAFREVEDNLAALRILTEEARVQEAATAAARRSVQWATNRYKGGVATYLEVIVAQSALLSSERAGVDITSRRLAASVLLMKALGGGWDVHTLPAL